MFRTLPGAGKNDAGALRSFKCVSTSCVLMCSDRTYFLPIPLLDSSFFFLFLLSADRVRNFLFMHQLSSAWEISSIFYSLQFIVSIKSSQRNRRDGSIAVVDQLLPLFVAESDCLSKLRFKIANEFRLRVSHLEKEKKKTSLVACLGQFDLWAVCCCCCELYTTAGKNKEKGR